jgi:hypothetical protein
VERSPSKSFVTRLVGEDREGDVNIIFPEPLYGNFEARFLNG